MSSSEVINSLSEYVSSVSEIGKTVVNCAGSNEALLFRGHSDSTYELVPGIGRGRESRCDISIFDEERNILDLAKMKLPDVFKESATPMETLALAQHYGLPTRLLDVSENALVALFFACEEEKGTDGEVFVFKSKDEISNMPIIQAIADSYRMVRGSDCSLDNFLRSAVNQPYFLEHKHMVETCFFSEASQEKFKNTEYEWMTDSDKWIENVCSKPIFVYAPIRTLRQQAQRGRYILFPNKIENYLYETDKKAFASIMEPIKKNDPCIVKTFTIPASAKEKLLVELKLFGICREYLFPDSIDEICQGIKTTCFDRVK